MSALWATFQRELRAYFFSPLAYAIAALMLIFNGILFIVIISFLANPMSQPGPPFELFFSLSWLVLLTVTPLLTMRLISEERRSGSIEVLMTAPVTEGQVVAGKYLAVLAFFASLWLPTVVYAVIVGAHTELDWGTVAAGYLGLFLIGALSLSIGVMASSFAKNQVVAAILALAILFCFFFVFGWAKDLVNGQAAKEVF
nr:ABC transporter permease subunit [Thermoanaerobaculia bacterium]